MALPARRALGTAPEAAAPADRELKFAVPAGRAGAVRRWLCAVCRPEARYPDNIVSTIYYDTPDLPSLGEKLNSDHLKLKIRVRWYTEPGGVPAGPAFVEAKLREGARHQSFSKYLAVYQQATRSTF